MGSLACPLPPSLLAQVRGGREVRREIQNATKLGVIYQGRLLTIEDGRGGEINRLKIIIFEFRGLMILTDWKQGEALEQGLSI